MLAALLADATAVQVDPETFLAIVAVAAVAGTLAAVVTSHGFLLPVVVVELVFGVLVGPQVAGLETSAFIDFFASLGLGMLFFFAGYEIDLHRIKGEPLKLALMGWGASLILAYSIGGLLAWAGIVLSLVYTGSALATTAIGTLIPILSDRGELKTRFGTYLLAAGAVGEFGPILILTIGLSTQSALKESLLLVGFVALAVVVAIVGLQSFSRVLPLFSATLESSSQVAIRWFVVLVFSLALLANQLGLDLLLGGFAAGIITRQMLKEMKVPAFDSKLTAIAFGLFVPFFFIVSGMKLDVDALFSSVGGVLKMFLFFVLFLVVRGIPVMLLDGRPFGRRDRVALGFLVSTQLPLVLAITTVAQDAGKMRASTAAALVGAAVLSTLVFPIVGLWLRGDPMEAEEPVQRHDAVVEPA